MQTVGQNQQSCLQRTSHCALVILSLITAKKAQAENAHPQGRESKVSAQGHACTELAADALCLSHGIHQQSKKKENRF